jgi:hypothetical protein
VIPGTPSSPVRERERGRGREGERESLNFYTSNGAHTLLTGQREREKEGGGEREKREM